MNLLKNSLLSTIALFFLSCGENTEKPLKDITTLKITANSELTIYSTDKKTENLLSAIITFDDNSTEDVTEFVRWNSSDTNVSYIIKGTIYAGKQNGGKTDINVTYKDLTSNGLSLSSKKLIDYNISMLNADANTTGTYQLQAMGTFEDNTTRLIATNIVWDSNNSAVFTTEDYVTFIEITEDTNISAKLFEDNNMSKEIVYIVE